MLRHSVQYATPYLKKVCEEWQNSTLRFILLPERGNKNNLFSQVEIEPTNSLCVDSQTLFRVKYTLYIFFILNLNLYFHFFALVSRQNAALSSATQFAMPPEFGRKWGTECLNIRDLVCAGYSVKLII